MFHDSRAAQRESILGAVGSLQFDVVRFRLENEYNAQTDIEWLPYKLARWIGGSPEQARQVRVPYQAKVVKDQLGHTAILFQSQWDADYFQRENPTLVLSPVRTSTFRPPAERETSALEHALAGERTLCGIPKAAVIVYRLTVHIESLDIPIVVD